MNLLDSVIASISPERALRRAAARHVLAKYEGGRSTKRNKKSRDNSSGERNVVRDAATVRATMRDMERNHDLVRGALLNLTRNVVGPNGISIEPQPRRGGAPGDANYDDIDDAFARDLLNLFREWSVAPEVTRTLSWVQCQELVCRTWLRDGEEFTQLVEGDASFIRHASRVPLSLELLEADVVPLDYQRSTPNVDAGIERNEWGQPLAYYMHKRHPGNGGGFMDSDLKRVPAERVLHLAVRERLSGMRGISLFASTIDRLLDCKNYEQDEQMAARIAARITAFVSRDVNMEGWSPPVDEQGKPVEREFLLEAGSVFENLAPGEKLELLNPSRPNTGLEKFRMALIRAASRATGLSYSTFSGDYDGTYSAQRQELVESYDSYRMLTHHFVSRFVRPIWERFVTLAIASGKLKVPSHIRAETVAWAEFRGPRMPWIDPVREANAMRILTRSGIESLQSQIADRGGRLQDTFEQLKRERALADELGLILDSDARYTSSSGVTQARPPGTSFPDDDPDPDPDGDASQGRGQRSRGSRARTPAHGETH
jgi:lambda family phage portal protein